MILTRRDFIRSGLGVAGALAVGDMLAACAGSATGAASPAPSLPPPETSSIRINYAQCDAPLMVCERFLREEGFTTVQFLDANPQLPALAAGKVDLAVPFVATLAAAVDGGKPFIGIGGLHPGCAQLWAPQSVPSLKDIRGHTVVVNGKTPDRISNIFIFIALKDAGIDPSEVNFVVQPAADLTQLYLDGKSDLLFAWGPDAVALQSNPANKGHLVLDQAMDAPWSREDCCVITTTQDWLAANPTAAKRALRAIYRAADTLKKDRSAAAKMATDSGLFGGPRNFELVRGAVNMVPYDWRRYDLATSMRFHASLLSSVGLTKMTAEDAVTRGLDVRLEKELISELRR